MSMDSDAFAKLAAGLGAIGAAWYGVVRMIKRDRREDKVASLHDEAIEHVIETLRGEVARLAQRLAAVEEQNRRCEERNDQLHQELMELKAKLHVT